MTKLISFKFSGFSGDVIHYMAGIKQVCKLQGAKAELYLWLDQSGLCYPGAVHPYGGKMINQYAFDMMKPLLEIQDYVEFVKPWQGEKIIVDMDKIRQIQVGMPNGSLAHWIGLAFPDMQCNLAESWLEIKQWSPDHQEKVYNKILINRTSRYQQGYISYFFLKDYRDKLMFVGLEEEHRTFEKQWGFEVEYLKVTDFWDLAKYMADCNFFIGNQSMCFAIAEALKVPRILEMCEYVPNVHPIGDQAHYFMFQDGLIYLVERLQKEWEENWGPSGTEELTKIV